MMRYPKNRWANYLRRRASALASQIHSSNNILLISEKSHVNLIVFGVRPALEKRGYRVIADVTLESSCPKAQVLSWLDENPDVETVCIVSDCPTLCEAAELVASEYPLICVGPETRTLEDVVKVYDGGVFLEGRSLLPKEAKKLSSESIPTLHGEVCATEQEQQCSGAKSLSRIMTEMVRDILVANSTEGITVEDLVENLRARLGKSVKSNLFTLLQGSKDIAFINGDWSSEVDANLPLKVVNVPDVVWLSGAVKKLEMIYSSGEFPELKKPVFQVNTSSVEGIPDDGLMERLTIFNAQVRLEYKEEEIVSPIIGHNERLVCLELAAKHVLEILERKGVKVFDDNVSELPIDSTPPQAKTTNQIIKDLSNLTCQLLEKGELPYQDVLDAMKDICPSETMLNSMLASVFNEIGPSFRERAGQPLMMALGMVIDTKRADIVERLGLDNIVFSAEYAPMRNIPGLEEANMWAVSCTANVEGRMITSSVCYHKRKSNASSMAAADILDALQNQHISKHKHPESKVISDFDMKSNWSFDLPTPTPLAMNYAVRIPGHQAQLNCYYTTDAKRASNWIKSNVLTPKLCRVGFDLEWPPPKIGEKIADASLVQIATKSAVLLAHICHMKEFPTNLEKVLSDPNLLKVGRGVHHDYDRLLGDYGVKLAGIVDLGNLVPYSGYELKSNSLQELTLQLLGIEMEKNHAVRTSDWSQKLDFDQISYSALDAWCGLRVFDVIEHRADLFDPFGFEYGLAKEQML